MVISLTEREVTMVISACNEYCELMGQSEDTKDYTEYMLETGLGSALRKMSRGRRLEAIFENYKTVSKYPTFEEWVAQKAESEEI